MTLKRQSWDEHWMEAAELASSRSTCRRRAVGAVLVRDNMQLSSGYNGSPRGAEHCVDTSCLREDLKIPSGTKHEMCKAVHAEQNAIIQCARTGTSCEGAILYTTTYPCSICAKIIINAGIKIVVYKGDYPDEIAKELFKDARIIVLKK